jgi:probable HAF family extracellular repeat protein
MTDLGTLGGHNSVGESVNRSGQVAGWADTSQGVNNAALWNGKKAVDLGALAPLSAGQASIAAGINDSGQVVGTYGTNNPEQAFLYSNGTITSLPQPSFTGPFGCEALAINNNSQIAGACWDGTGTAHLVLWRGGTATDLGTLGTPGTFTNPEAIAINSTGQIAGWVSSSNGNNGFSYGNGTLTDLGTFAGAAINDNGIMVGGPTIDNGGTMQNLNTLTPAGSGYTIQNATAINDNGQIVANTTSNHALLLTPA